MAFGISGTAVATQGVSNDEVIIGTAVDISGPAASLGKEMLNGLRMRVAEANDQGGVNGRKIKLLVEDHGYDAKRGVLAAQKLVQQEKIFAMVGMMSSGPVIASMPILLDNGVISFMPVAGTRESFEPYHKLKYALMGPNFEAMKFNTPRVYQMTKATKACAIYQDDEMGLEIVRGAEAGLKEVGVEMVEKAGFKRGSTDLSSQVARVKGANCDFVVLGQLTRETVVTMTEMRKLGYSPTVFGSNYSYTDQVAQLGGKAVDGLYADMTATLPNLEFASPPLRAWIGKYKTMFGVDPNMAVTYGYQAMDKFVIALQKVGRDLTTESFIKTMDSMTFPPDVFGAPEQTYTATKRLGSNRTRASQLQNGHWKIIMDYPK